MRVSPRIASLLLLTAAAGCRPAPAHGPLTLAAEAPAQPVSLLRLARAGGKPALYRFPSLKPSAWVGREALPAIRRPLGADLDGRLVYVLDTKDNVAALDLESGRQRPVLPNVAAAAVGPDGTLYAVAQDRTVTEVADRSPLVFPGKLSALPVRLFGGGDETVLALLGGKTPTLAVADRQQPPTEHPVPAGEATTTNWGNIVAIAADSAVVVVTPASAHPYRTLEAGPHVRQVLFSPSGHRLYAARDGADELTVFDRFTWSKIDPVPLPGAPRAIRADPLGRFLLVRPATGDSVWVLDLSTNELLGTWGAPWSDDLPAIAGSRFLVLRQGQDVVTYDLASAKLPETGRVPGGAADLWLILDWAPRGEALAGASADTAALVAADTAAESRVFVQVSSSQNPAWADELARKLSRAGLPASVIKPEHPDEGYRVVLGPYPSREAAESTGKRLGQPYFIYTPDLPGR
ncbi:MAG TPA: SPOR domain-containing protein [Gemmatimonadales bacterium]|nr:SPOR domain-containing protein [Gemmatimonadales bacterium]